MFRKVNKKTLVGMGAAVALAITPLAAGNPAETHEDPAAYYQDQADKLRQQLRYERQQANQERTALIERFHGRIARFAQQNRGLRRTIYARPNIKRAIRLAAVTQGVPYRTLVNVARCESRLNATAVNPTPIWNGEHAHGLFQFIPSTWRKTPQGRAGMSIFDPYANAMGAADLIRRDGLRQWHCKADGRPHG